MKSLLCLFLFGFLSPLWGVEPGKVLAVSQSGTTVTLNYGKADGLFLGDLALFFYRPTQENEGPPRFSGEGRVVASYLSHSLWRLDYGVSGFPLKRNDEVILFKVGDYKKYKGQLEVLRRNYVLKHRTAYDLSEIMDSEGRDFPMALIKGEEIKSSPIGATPEVSQEGASSQIEVRDLSFWYLPENERRLYIKALKRAPKDEVLIDRRYKADFETVLASYFQMIGNPAVNLQHYKSQEKDGATGLVNEHLSLKNTYEDGHEEKVFSQKEREYIEEERAFNEDRWSARMNDQELSRYLHDTGLDQERRRQEGGYDRLSAREVKIFGGGFSPYSYEYRLGYEFYGWFLDSSLESFSLNFWGGFDQDPFMSGAGRTHTNKWFGALELRYYVVGYPDLFFKPSLFVGGAFGVGQSSLTLDARSRIHNSYQNYLIPSFTLGLKVRLGQYVGVEGGFSWERWRYHVREAVPQTGFPYVFTHTVGRVFVGLDFFL